MEGLGSIQEDHEGPDQPGNAQTVAGCHEGCDRLRNAREESWLQTGKQEGLISPGMPRRVHGSAQECQEGHGSIHGT